MPRKKPLSHPTAKVDLIIDKLVSGYYPSVASLSHDEWRAVITAAKNAELNDYQIRTLERHSVKLPKPCQSEHDKN